MHGATHIKGLNYIKNEEIFVRKLVKSNKDVTHLKIIKHLCFDHTECNYEFLSYSLIEILLVALTEQNFININTKQSKTKFKVQ